MTLKKEDILDILKQVEYKDWTFIVDERDGGFLLQATFDGKNSRKWYISKYSTHSEIVQTVLKVILTAEEHEVRCNFKYRGKYIFGPHINVECLLDICDEKEVRK